MRQLAERGLTLIELMVGLAIAAILVVAAGPFFTDYIANSRLREGGNLLFSETLMAQSEAIKRNTRVAVVTTATSVEVQDVTVATTPVMLRQRTLPAGISMDVDSVTFGSDGRPAPFPIDEPVAIDLGHDSHTCSADIRCPGLRVSVGGAVSLCRDKNGSC